MLKYQAVAVQKVNNQVVINGFIQLLGHDFVEFRLVDQFQFAYLIQMKQDHDGLVHRDYKRLSLGAILYNLRGIQINIEFMVRCCLS